MQGARQMQGWPPGAGVADRCGGGRQVRGARPAPRPPARATPRPLRHAPRPGSTTRSDRSWQHHAVTAPSGLTHACARCGEPVPLDVGLCERCNPLGLRDSSSSQVHGIAIAGVIGAVVLLAIAGKFLLAGVGPFESVITGAVPDGSGMVITLSVTNLGESAGQTTCRVTDPKDRTGNLGSFILSPAIDSGETVEFSQRVTELGGEPRQLRVECSQP